MSSLGERNPFRIAIIGGGIAGLFAALSIHHHCYRQNQKDANTNVSDNTNGSNGLNTKLDIEIDVYEQAPEYKEIGAGLGLAVNAAKLLDRIGLFDDVRAIAGSRGGVWISFRRYDDSREIHTVPLKDETTRQKQLSVHRAEFLEILVRAVRDRKAATLHTNKRCVQLEDLGEEMKVTFADGTTTTANLVIGADGIHSTVRSHYIGDNAQFGNMIVYRGLCPMSEVQGWWPFDTYSVSWLAPGKHVLVYPISSNNILNIVAFVTTKKEDLGDTTQESWTMAGDKDSVKRDFSEFDTPVQRVIELMDTQPQKWILYDRQPFKRWVFAGGKVALLGDAAHAMLPHQGAGAGQAVEDGYILGRTLHDFLSSRSATTTTNTTRSQEDWLHVYQSVRLPRTERVQATSRQAGELYEMEAPELKGLTYDECVPIVKSKIQDRMDWIWSEDIDQAYEKARG
ncbi:hypothetical protein VTN77DRAFT_8216 [Rasamsonia byssochlamydoides]|uniref:uncharacterized protein n=1 Tax=Rasamsonia byssochlamydoides TaxID=89139 RepID=UPI0037448EDE